MAKTRERKGQIVPRISRDMTPFDELDRMFDHFLESGFLRPFHMHWPEWARMREFEMQMPRVDVIDREDEVLVRAELPGVKKDQLDLTVSEHYLTLKGEAHEEKEEKGEFYRSEIHHGSFTRTVRLPDLVDADKAEASFSEGVLEVRIPKSEGVKKHKVDIK
jgi:HSP20 family protein